VTAHPPELVYVPEPAEAAREYLRRGYAPLPIEPGTKRPPATLRNWPFFSLTPESADAWFGEGASIGLILGTPSGGLVDVDLDCPEAIELASQYLPPTKAVTGRGNSPRSHWWYRAPGARTAKHQTPAPDREVIVELRSTGLQTLVGPSVHPDGDRYDFLGAEPAVVDPVHLTECVARLADAVLERRGLLKQTPDPLKSEPRTSSPLSSPTGYGARALAEECRKVRETLEGGRNEQLNTSAYKIGQLVGGGELDEGDAERALTDAGHAVGLPVGEVRATVRSGMRAGKLAPRVRAQRANPADSRESVDFHADSRESVDFHADSTAIHGDPASQGGGDDLPPPLDFVPIDELIDRHDKLRPPLIEGLLREGETMNIVAAPKSKKSWLVLDLALSVALGKPWLGIYGTVPGKVLIVDNELHPETSAFRVRRVLDEHRYSREEYRGRVLITNLRGRLCDIYGLRRHLVGAAERGVKLIVLDAFYRFMPLGESENDNATVAGLYNEIDRLASDLGVAFVLIHHTSKGAQSGKSVTDVGAGAGSQSRAADTHLILRDHEEENAIVLDAVVRSWRPPEPRGLTFEFPVWRHDPDLDLEALAGSKPRRGGGAKAVEPKPEKPPEMTPAEFMQAFVDDEPTPRSVIEKRARDAKVPVRVIAACVQSIMADCMANATRANGQSPWLLSLKAGVE